MLSSEERHTARVTHRYHLLADLERPACSKQECNGSLMTSAGRAERALFLQGQLNFFRVVGGCAVCTQKIVWANTTTSLVYVCSLAVSR